MFYAEVPANIRNDASRVSPSLHAVRLDHDVRALHAHGGASDSRAGCGNMSDSASSCESAARRGGDDKSERGREQRHNTAKDSLQHHV